MYPYSDYNWNRDMLEEERRLMREINSQRMSWNKLGKILKLNALMSARRRDWTNHY